MKELTENELKKFTAREKAAHILSRHFGFSLETCDKLIIGGICSPYAFDGVLPSDLIDFGFTLAESSNIVETIDRVGMPKIVPYEKSEFEGMVEEGYYHNDTSDYRMLALRAYPELKQSGYCSRHRGSGYYECTICYPDLNVLLSEHVSVSNKLYDELLSLTDLKDPENGRVGLNAIIAKLKQKLSQHE